MSEQIESHIYSQFKILKKIGSGAYGHVWKVIDRQNRGVKALKKNFDAFNNSTDAQRTYRQIMFLMELSHTNIIRLEQVIKADNDKDIYLIFEHMDIDLYTLIREGILAEKHMKYILYQMAKAIHYLHSVGLVHRDLKPSNVLVNENCQAKLCDFGLVRSIYDEEDDQFNILTQYIATRWYRAPQILLGSLQYSKAIDIWSFGCLLAEMQKGKPLFPGSSTMNQIQKVLAWTDIPNQPDVESLKLKSQKDIIEMLPKVKKINKKQMIPNASQSCMDLINRCLDFNPEKRPTIEQILHHPYLREFLKQNQIQLYNTKINIPIDDNRRLSLKDYRSLIYQEINKKNKCLQIHHNQHTLYRIRQKMKKSSKNHLIAEVKPGRNIIKDFKESGKQTIKDKISNAISSQTNTKDSKTISIKKTDASKKKSFYKGDSLQSKHLKTIEKEWNPIQTKKASMIREQTKQSKNCWVSKKRSVTQSDSKKPVRIFPSQIEIYR